MVAINNYIEEKAERLLINSNCNKLPININQIIKYLKIKINALELEEDVSGFCVIKEDSVHIGYNKNESPVRNRFTIAHEIGHYLLHAQGNPIFIDKTQKYDRNNDSSTGKYQIEREANAFAAALLMPRKLLLEKIKKIDKKSETMDLDCLAKKFLVSTQAMTIRLTNLDLIDYFSATH